MTTNIGQTSGNSSKGNDSVPSRISHLLCPGCPVAILLVVVPVVVASFDFTVIWPNAHVRQENGEIVPALANRDTPASIVEPSVISWIGASSKHMLPRAVGSTIPRPYRVSVPSEPIDGEISVVTAARNYGSRFQGIISHRDNISFKAATDTCGSGMTPFSKRYFRHANCKNNKSSKLGSGGYDLPTHNSGSFVVVFSCGSQHQLASAANLPFTIWYAS